MHLRCPWCARSRRCRATAPWRLRPNAHGSYCSLDVTPPRWVGLVGGTPDAPVRACPSFIRPGTLPPWLSTDDPEPHHRYSRRACRHIPSTGPPVKTYKLDPSIILGLGPSDIPHAGWGVLAFRPIKVGNSVLDYSGSHRSKVRYVSSDENETDALADSGRVPVYVDARIALSCSSCASRRGTECGPEYWQGHLHSLPPSVQAEAAVPWWTTRATHRHREPLP